MEDLQLFEQRKKDHIRIALDERSQSLSESRLHEIQLLHEALPEINLSEVVTTESPLELSSSALFVSSMTAGHIEGESINMRLAAACQKKNWLMGVGSQRRQLTDSKAQDEWKKILDKNPDVKLLGNIGISQILDQDISKVEKLVSSLQAKALFVHTNPLQESFQPEGTPQFRGGINALKNLCEAVSVPVILKETGCGFSKSTLEKLNGIGLYAVDVAGSGGTNWGLIEGARSLDNSLLSNAALSFSSWGHDTVTSLLNANELNLDYKVWGSGGVRNGLDAAKLIALGCEIVGFAKPIMEAAIKDTRSIVKMMELFEYELKVALFCSGCISPEELRQKKAWIWKKTNL